MIREPLSFPLIHILKIRQCQNECEDGADMLRRFSCMIQYVGLASYVVLLWDHVDTFPDEVSRFTVQDPQPNG